MSLIAMPFGLAARSGVIDCGFHSHQPITKGSDHDRLPIYYALRCIHADPGRARMDGVVRRRLYRRTVCQPADCSTRDRRRSLRLALVWRPISAQYSGRPKRVGVRPARVELACREQSPSYSRREREDEGSSKPQRIGAGKYKEVPQSIIALERESNRPVGAADVCCATCGPSWQPSARHRRGIAAWKFDSINHSSGLLRLFLDREICRHQLGPDQPPVVRAQVTARNSAVSGPLDCWAALYGDGAMTIDPLVHGRWCYTKHIGQCFLATKGSTGFFDSVHFRNYSFATDKMQAMLYVSFDSVAI